MTEIDRVDPSDGISPGTLVRVRNNCRDVNMTPNALIKAGWPQGEFLVVARRMLPIHGIPGLVDCITLDPCCYFCRNVATGRFLCEGHPVELFQSARIEESARSVKERKPESEMVVDTPIGEMLGVRFYAENEDSPASLVLTGVSGKKPIVVHGGIAAKFKDILREVGLL